ncbi:MAG: acyl-CoA thioesterase [Acetobacteraceae bacterium]|nr:acyl-CoA thioesterase [Acetobacteraceae bacterium]
MSRPTEPYVHTRRILFGDTDAARVVYTPRFLEYAMEALDFWFTDRLGVSWYDMNVKFNVGTPFVHTAIDYRSALTPRDTLSCTVRLVKRGGSSLHFSVIGQAGDRLVFEAKLVCAVARTDIMKPTRPPAEWEPALAAELAIGAAGS